MGRRRYGRASRRAESDGIDIDLLGLDIEGASLARGPQVIQDTVAALSQRFSIWKGRLSSIATRRPRSCDHTQGTPTILP